MLVVVDVAGLVDQQYGDAVVYAVGPPQPRVVQHLNAILVDQHEGTAISRAHQNAQ